MTRKSYAKVNIFLKIVGKRDNYHELASRFIRVKNLFDTITFTESSCDKFTLEGDFGCTTEKNTIYKAYVALKELSSKVESYFQNHKVIVEKNIPEFAGLGGGSSNCATFINMVNEVCELKLSKDQLSSIGAKIGADVPFFIYEYDSANVSGIGEIVEPFEEEALDLEVITPNIMCNTGKIFTSFRDKFYNEAQLEETTKLFKTKSLDILNNTTIEKANDLYLPAVDCENKLKNYAKENWFFSGSGSSFFRLKESNG